MKTLHAVTGCLSDYDPDAMPVSVAQAVIRTLATPVAAVEKVALRAALGRVLAQDLLARLNVPGADNSAMDGYAFDGAGLPSGAAPSAPPMRLKVVGTSFAGRAYTGIVAPGACVRIMTGALIPAACDTVIAQEHVDLAGTTAQPQICFEPGRISPGANIRRMGEDLAAGSVALKQGRVVQASDLGLLASLGYAEVPVTRRLRVAFFSTGDELRSIGQTLEPGCVYDSNRYTMYGMLHRLGVEIIDLGIVPDQAAELEATLRTAAACADAVITSGGVSVGDADYTRELMARLGEVVFWKVAMRPGRPFAFGRLALDGKPGALFFGLPGNPVAVMVSFYQFVREALLSMAGATSRPTPVIRAAASIGLRKQAGRTEFLRAIAQRNPDGNWQVAPTGAQGSGVLSSMSQANCFIVLAHTQSDVASGDTVDVMLFDGLI
jgi:molybdopterin molybdotransferase